MDVLQGRGRGRGRGHTCEPHTPALAGCDGVVSIWDGANKKRLHQVAGYPTSVAALAFNASATLLAVASSYTFEQVSHTAGPRG